MEKTTGGQKAFTFVLVLLLIAFLVLDVIVFVSHTLEKKQANTAVTYEEETDENADGNDDSTNKSYRAELNNISITAGKAPETVTKDNVLNGDVEMDEYSYDDYDE